MNHLLLTLSPLLLFFPRHKFCCVFSTHARATIISHDRLQCLFFAPYMSLHPLCAGDVLFNSYRPYNSQTHRVWGKEHSRAVECRSPLWLYVVRKWKTVVLFEEYAPGLKKPKNSGEHLDSLPPPPSFFTLHLASLYSYRTFAWQGGGAVRILPNSKRTQ